MRQFPQPTEPPRAIALAFEQIRRLRSELLALVMDDRTRLGAVVPPGGMLPFGGAAAPAGWLLCSGAAVSRVTYADLFGAIGIAWGAGDGSTTFNLPDLRGRAPFGLDNMGGVDGGRLSVANTLGTGGGAENALPAHVHDLAHGHGGGSTGGFGETRNVEDTGGFIPGVRDPIVSAHTGGGVGYYAREVTQILKVNIGAAPHSHTISNAAGNTGSTGSGASTMPPYALVNWIIKS